MAVNQFKNDSALLYHLYIQYIGTEGHGSNICKKNIRNNNSYKLRSNYWVNYKNKSYLVNKSTEAKQKLNTFTYHGDRTRFNIEEYYNRLTYAFTNLAYYVPSHKLKEN